MQSKVILISLLSITTNVLAAPTFEECEALPRNTFNEMTNAENCFKKYNSAHGVSIDYTETDKAYARLAETNRRKTVENNQLASEYERNNLIREQNKLLKQQIQNEQQFQDRVLAEIQD